MGNWDIGRWRGLTRSCYPLVSEMWSRQTDSPFSDLLCNSPGPFLLPSWFASIPLHPTGPWFWQDVAFASVLSFGYTYSVGFPWHFLSCPCLGLNASGGFSSWRPGEGLLLHLWAFATVLLLCLLPPSPWFVQLLPSVRDCAWHFVKTTSELHTTAL